jgi:hypothetical protein
VEGVDHYLARGVKYFVIRPEVFGGSRKAGSVGGTFLDSLRADPRISLAARFEGVDHARVSPIIEVYMVKDDGNAVPLPSGTVR